MAELLWVTSLRGIQEELRRLDRQGFIARCRVDHYTRRNREDRAFFSAPFGIDDSKRPDSGYWVKSFLETRQDTEETPETEDQGILRQYWYHAEGNHDRMTRNRFLRLTREAGDIVGTLPQHIRQIIWRDWPVDWDRGNEFHRWMNAICELGWRNRDEFEFRGSPLRADRYIVMNGLPVVQSSLDYFMDTFMVPDHVRENVRRDIWFARINDAVTTSIHMIDLLVALECPPTSSPTREVQQPSPVPLNPIDSFSDLLETGQQQKLFRFLSERNHSVCWSSLPEDAFRSETPTDDAIEKALKRLQARLTELHELYQFELEVTRSTRRTRLIQPSTNQGTN